MSFEEQSITNKCRVIISFIKTWRLAIDPKILVTSKKKIVGYYLRDIHIYALEKRVHAFTEGRGLEIGVFLWASHENLICISS